MVASSKTRFASAVKLTAACPSARVTMPLYVVHTVPSTVDSSTRKLLTTSPHSVRSCSWSSEHSSAAAGAFVMGTAEATEETAADETVDETVDETADGASVEETAADETVEEMADVTSVGETAEETEVSAVVGEGAGADDDGISGSLVTSVLLDDGDGDGDGDGDTCTAVVVVFGVGSTDDSTVGTNGGPLWCPGCGLHRDASAMGERMPKRTAADKNCILEKGS